MAGERLDFAVESHLAGITVDFEPAEPEYIPVSATLPPEDGSNPSEEFPWFEGFRQIVIRAHLQTNDAVHRVAARGQHEDRKAGAFANLAADVKAIHVGEHQVQYDRIEGLTRLERQTGRSSF